jgi:hypothetical protein
MLCIFHGMLIWNVVYNFSILSRLTYALCLNFLSVIHLDSHITGVLDLEDTAFTSVSFLYAL